MPLLLLIVLALSLPVPVRAQTQPDFSAPAAVQAAADTSHVAVPEPSERALRYHRSGNLLWVVSTLWSLLVLGAILFSGLSARLRDAAGRLGHNWLLAVAAYAVLFSALSWAVDLPLSYYAGYVRPHAYDLSNQSLGKWWGDEVKGLLVGAAGLALSLWIPYLLLRRSPRRWWLYTALAAVPLTIFVLLVSPVWVDPLFNDFGPMRDKQLEARILALAERAGIEGGDVYEVDKSVDTETLNAYVTGFGGTKRIVLWDTLLRKMGDEEVLFVMGHEMGHYVLGHTYWLIALNVLLVLVSLYAVHRTSGWLIARFGGRFGFHRLDDVASLPLLLLVVSVVGLAVTPVLFVVTRHFEHEADRFGLEITRNNRAAATAFLKLQQENLAIPYPGPLYRLWRSSHPPLGERVEFANRYRPWDRGEPLRYGERFE